ncbi:unnamed protein product [Symbiodinium natans]|uniref:Pentatricopeptide repeat-containing protein, chloroplastic n=1 Tax=Symbiodinium natans TaxID=878477 RepID=A0A812LQE6_9DINO|nr:unnamed protein product [Symbiodinium natans]
MWASPSKELSRLALACRKKAGAWQEAVSFLAAMQGMKEMPDQRAWGALISACAAGKAWPVSLALLEEAAGSKSNHTDISPPVADTMMFNDTMAGAMRQKQWPAVLALFQRLHDAPAGSPRPNVATYSLALKACEQGSQWPAGFGLLGQMRDEAVHPNTVTYNTFISLCTQGLRWADGVAALHQLQQEGLRPTAITYGSLIAACGKCSEPLKALKFLKEMEAAKVQPSVPAVTAAIRACEQGGLWQEAFRLFGRLKTEEGLPPDLTAYNATLSASEKGAKWDEALEVLKELEEGADTSGRLQVKPPKPDAISYNAIITACGNGMRWDLSLMFLQRLRDQAAPGVSADVISFNATAAACERASQWLRALALLGDLLEDGIQRLGLHCQIRGSCTVLLAAARADVWPKALVLQVFLLTTSAFRVWSLAVLRDDGIIREASTGVSFPSHVKKSQKLVASGVRRKFGKIKVYAMALYLEESSKLWEAPSVDLRKILEAQLASERERCDKAKRKVRQLLAKISERDRKIANLSSKLEAEVASRKSGGYGAVNGQQAEAVDLARQRAEIVAQLEDHLAQMRQDLLESEYEIQELESRQASKEEELSVLAIADRSPERMQAMAMIGLQIQEKKRFGTEMAHKIQALERQVHEQRAVIVELLSGKPRRATAEPSVRPRAMQMPNALEAFLDAAGPSEARLISQRPALLSAFAESQELTDGAIEGCSEEERVQILSLFTAWATVSTSALHVSDLQLSDEEVEEMVGTLESCEEVKEWEMTRCRCSESAMRKLLGHFASQPLLRLGLSYNALGLQGARLLAEAAAAGGWQRSLGCLSLEMNGLGDAGCKQVASLVKQHLPALSVLELGWNEVTPASAPDLAQLLQAPDPLGDAPGLPVLLRRLGLAGNSLSSAASGLVMAALSDPSREMELDLSMNHVDAKALRDVAEWARARRVPEVAEVQVHLTVSLEWNSIDDPQAVRHLADALSNGKLMVAEAGQPLIQLANNELLDLPLSKACQKPLACWQVLRSFLLALTQGPTLKRGSKLQFDFEKAGVKVHIGDKYAVDVKSNVLTRAFLSIYLDKHAVAPDFRHAVFQGCRISD